MIFGNPHMLWLLLVLPPALLAFFWWSARVRQRLVTQFIQARLLPVLTVGISPARQRFRLGCLLFAVICIVLALARPQWGFEWEETKQRGLDIVVAIDTSKSMLAEDIVPNRLTRAKLAALDLMQQARSDRLGLVAFAGTAFLQCPLTVDDAAFRQSVEALDVNIIPQGGTALASAIEAALTAFKEGDNYRVLVLFTDGEDHDSGALDEAKKAAEAGLRIYTIGVGTAEGEVLRVKDAAGHTDYIRDEQGNVVKSHLNEELLQSIAQATEGGFYLPLRGAKTIDMLYQQALAKLPKSQHEAKLVKRYHERYHWPLAAALVLLITEMLFPERKTRTESPRANPGEKGLRPALALLLVVLGVPGLAGGSPSSALREYKAGKFDQALKEYHELLQRKNDDPRLHFNAGAAAYRNRQFDEAAKQFNEALASPDLKLQGLSYYNRGNTLFHLGEQAADPTKRNEAWEKSIKDYESSLKLDPQDPDAKFNRDYVKKLLEELKQQQQPQQNSNQDKSDQQKQDQQQQQQQQQSKNDQSQSEQQKSQPQKNQSGEKQDQQQQQARQQQQDEEKKQAAQAQEQKDQQDQQQAQQAGTEQKEKSDEKDKEAAAYAQGQMTPQQARQLLDAQKNDEKLLPPNPEKPTEPNRRFKDW